MNNYSVRDMVARPFSALSHSVGRRHVLVRHVSVFCGCFKKIKILVKIKHVQVSFFDCSLSVALLQQLFLRWGLGECCLCTLFSLLLFTHGGLERERGEPSS